MLATVLMVSILSVCSILNAQQVLDQRDSDFYSIVTINAKRMGTLLNTTPNVLVNYAKSMCAEIPQIGAAAVIEKNRHSSESIQGNEVGKQQVADMVFRNSVSTYCSEYTQQAFNALNAPASNQQTARSEAKSENSIYERFRGVASGIDMRLQFNILRNDGQKRRVIDRDWRLEFSLRVRKLIVPRMRAWWASGAVRMRDKSRCGSPGGWAQTQGLPRGNRSWRG
jgi:hypothetical protein